MATIYSETFHSLLPHLIEGQRHDIGYDNMAMVGLDLGMKPTALNKTHWTKASYSTPTGKDLLRSENWRRYPSKTTTFTKEYQMSYRYPTQSEPRSAENLPKSVEPPLKPMARTEDEPREFRIADVSSFQFADHQGFERWLDLSGIVNSRSKVFVSISEIGLFFGEWKPFMGAASCDIHNVVPQDDGIVIVRGVIGWDQDINVRLSVLVA